MSKVLHIFRMKFKTLLMVFTWTSTVILVKSLPVPDCAVGDPTALFPDSDCTIFYRCDGNTGVLSEFPCPPGMYFSTAVDACDAEERVPECIGGTRAPIEEETTTTAPSTGPDCNIGDPDAYFPNNEDCNRYYFCDGTTGVLDELKCLLDLYFNPASNSCEFQSSVPECVGGTRVPPVEETTTTAMPPTRPECTIGDPDTFFPHEDCSLFYFCRGSNGVLMELMCPPDLYFSLIAEDCRPKDEVPECIGGTREPPGGETTTRPSTITTTEPEVTTTLAPGSCPEAGVIVIAHEDRCQSFYICYGGSRSQMYNCAEGRFFDPEIQECYLPEVEICPEKH